MTLSQQLSWSHFHALLPIKDSLARDFYAEMCRIGQMEFYLRWLDKYERVAGEEAPIGLILCSAADTEQVELLELDAKSIRVAEYLTELPPLPLLRARLQQAITHARESADRQKLDEEDQQ